jgi:hypothetical protein
MDAFVICFLSSFGLALSISPFYCFLKSQVNIFAGGVEEYSDFGDKSFKCHHCGALFWNQERLANSSRATPLFSPCCVNGKVKLLPLKPTPMFLDFLLDPGKGSILKKLCENIRAYYQKKKSLFVVACEENQHGFK